MLLFYDKHDLWLYYLIMGIMSYLNYFIILFDNVINRPVEAYVNVYFRNKAIDKLNSMNNMDVIGITGSYGKTSTKNIVYDILNVKYNVFKTPENYNTPYGLMISINNFLDKYNDYFIAEMGACKRGDIKEMCDLVHPKYGILTKIGIAHLETFGSEENIQKTKFELIESLPEDGIGVLNGDDPKQVDYILKNNCKIVWIGIDNKRVNYLAKDIVLTNKGTKFTLKVKGRDVEYPFETKLLGKANIYNILAGIALGHELGISIKDLQSAVKKVQPVEHRLCMGRYYDINLIDDAYNANPQGCAMAIEVLAKMPGKKIVVTSGMIELGSKSYEENKKLGVEIAEAKIDEVILIGKNQTEPINDGLVESGYNKKKIHVLNNVMDAFPLMRQLKEGDTYVLLQSDLPDTFNEK
jgi:UDP-N-acetylmuramoyl-tripeptide--D-alanyl-D-alanine ligase